MGTYHRVDRGSSVEGTPQIQPPGRLLGPVWDLLGVFGVGGSPVEGAPICSIYSMMD